MKRNHALLALAFVSSSALAQQTQPAAMAEPSPLTGNLTIASEYRFRGIDQTAGKPAVQGGVDYTHPSGAYFGNWNSNVNQNAGYPGATLEMDFYGGYKKMFGPLGFDVGAIYYYYPGSDAAGLANPHTGQRGSGTVHNTEIYAGVGWRMVSLKWFRALADYFGVPNTRGTEYFDVTLTDNLGNGWGVVVHVGRLNVDGYAERNYTDYKIGLTRDFTGWVLGAAFVNANARGNCPGDAISSPYCFTNPAGQGPLDAGRTSILFSASKTF